MFINKLINSIIAIWINFCRVGDYLYNLQKDNLYVSLVGGFISGAILYKNESYESTDNVV